MTFAVGALLPEYVVTARMPAELSENKIHEDGLARQLGFRGGLVPGVTVYAWMTHPVVAAFGRAWLERGRFSVRFTRPVYFDERVTVRSRAAERSGDTITLDSEVVNAAGETCATGNMSLPDHAPPAPDVGAYPAAALPAERPLVSREVLESRTVLGTPELLLDEAAVKAFLGRVNESLPLYDVPDGLAHPGLYLDQANRALSRNVRVSPWIHVESHGQHLGPARVGERIETRGRVARLFDRKGHELVELDLLLVVGGRPVAKVQHVAIYRLRGSA